MSAHNDNLAGDRLNLIFLILIIFCPAPHPRPGEFHGRRPGPDYSCHPALRGPGRRGGVLANNSGPVRRLREGPGGATITSLISEKESLPRAGPTKAEKRLPGRPPVLSQERNQGSCRSLRAPRLRRRGSFSHSTGRIGKEGEASSAGGRGRGAAKRGPGNDLLL